MFLRRTWWVVPLGDWAVMFWLVMMVYWSTVPLEVVTMVVIIWIVVAVVPTVVYD